MKNVKKKTLLDNREMGKIYREELHNKRYLNDKHMKRCLK